MRSIDRWRAGNFFVYNNYIINNKSDKRKKMKSTNDSTSLTVTRSKCATDSDVFV
jgi:hypothetical protein